MREAECFRDTSCLLPQVAYTLNANLKLNMFLTTSAGALSSGVATAQTCGVGSRIVTTNPINTHTQQLTLDCPSRKQSNCAVQLSSPQIFLYLPNHVPCCVVVCSDQCDLCYPPSNNGRRVRRFLPYQHPDAASRHSLHCHIVRQLRAPAPSSLPFASPTRC